MHTVRFMRNQSYFLFDRPRNAQKGVSVVSALLGLLIAGIVANGVVQNLSYRNKQQLGTELSKRVAPVRETMNRYISENYHLLQSDQPVVRNGVTLAAGTAIGQSMSPRVQDLINLGYLPPNFNVQLSLLDSNSSLITSLRKEPVGCVSVNCEIPGYVYLSKPILQNATEANAVLIGQYRSDVGPDALISSNARRTILSSSQGMSVPNPVAGSPAGVVGVLVGWGSSGYGQFLVVNDSRNPNFRGDLSVRGEIKSETKISAPNIVGDESVGAGTGNNGTDCRMAEITASGQVISRVASCLKKVVIDPARATVTTFFSSGVKAVEISGEDSTVSMNRSNGVESIKMDGNNSQVIMRNANGVARATLSGEVGALDLKNAAGISTVKLNSDNGKISSSDGSADRFSADQSGNLRVRASGGVDKGGFDVSDGSGRVFGDVIHANYVATKGAACVSGHKYGDIAKNSQGAGLLMCNGSKWIPITSVSASAGGWCPTNDEIAVSPDGSSLICSGNYYVRISDRFGKRILTATYPAYHGTWLPKPACQSGTSGSNIFLIPKNLSTDSVRLNYYATDHGSSWAISILNNLGVAVGDEAIAQVFCLYH